MKPEMKREIAITKKLIRQMAKGRKATKIHAMDFDRRIATPAKVATKQLTELIRIQKRYLKRIQKEETK